MPPGRRVAALFEGGLDCMANLREFSWRRFTVSTEKMGSCDFPPVGTSDVGFPAGGTRSGREGAFGSPRVPPESLTSTTNAVSGALTHGRREVSRCRM